MAKAYWVSSYRSISNPEAVAAYAKLAGPALAAAGGKFLARGVAAQGKDLVERTRRAPRITAAGVGSFEHGIQGG